jgi:hypothetical protein
VSRGGAGEESRTRAEVRLVSQQLDLLTAPPVRRPTRRRERPIVRELVRRQSNKDRVLARLQQGPASNVELNGICFRYGARIFELIRDGHPIRKTHVGDGVWRYTLVN